ncbi:hypothetical protein AB0A73_21980 [Glycomyces sp. NPDC047369]
MPRPLIAGVLVSLLSELIAELQSLTEQSRDTRAALHSVDQSIESASSQFRASTRGSGNDLVQEGLTALASAVDKLNEADALLAGGADRWRAYIDGPLLGGAASGGGAAAGGARRGPSVPKPTKSHGTLQKRAGATSGPVIFSIPRRLDGKLSTEHRRQAQEYIDAGNQALRDGKLSASGRVRPSQDPTLKNEKEMAARRERDRAEAAGEPYGDLVAAHLPDTTWAGTAQPPGGWGRHDEVINSSLGSQSDKYPVGYKPNGFHLDSAWDSAVDTPADQDL